MKLNGINNAVGCYKVVAQCGVSLVMSPFASFNEIWGTAMNFIFFCHDNTTG